MTFVVAFIFFAMPDSVSLQILVFKKGLIMCII